LQNSSFEFCHTFLPKVSRTFALSISQLKEPLRTEVCITYLICRILDTIEDSPSLSTQRKKEAITSFLEALKNEKNKEDLLSEIFNELDGKSAENDADLLRNGRIVTSAFHSTRKESQKAIYPWVEEMGKGMVLYCQKMEGKDSLKQIKTLRDLDDYCYYIAGTVGFMLTNLFKLNCENIDNQKYEYLNKRANDFGLALQKVNILKDIRDDYLRGWVFIPLELLSKANIEPSDLLDENNGEKVFNSLSPLFETLKKNLKSAFEYLTSIPETEKEVRLFLSTSLFFAVATIDLINKKKKDFLSQEKLKISRLQVSKILYDLETKCSSNAKLQKMWSKYQI